LDEKYSASENVIVKHGKAIDVIEELEDKVDIVNAIGVMFHIVDDNEWKITIKGISDIINSMDYLLLAVTLGCLVIINVQIDNNKLVNKRLRSFCQWKKELKINGFTHVRLYRNNSYLWINDKLPESNIIIAVK
jgi:hypothetical protein